MLIMAGKKNKVVINPWLTGILVGVNNLFKAVEFLEMFFGALPFGIAV